MQDQFYTPYYQRKRTVMAGDKCWRCGKPMPVESIGNPLWLFRSEERSFRAQSIMRLFCSAECLKKFQKGETRMAVICKYCGKDLPREYAPGERSEFCTTIKGGRKKKDGTAGTERILHFCSKACVEWKTYKDKINRQIGRLNAGQISSAELYDYIDKMVKPAFDDPMATAEAPVTTLEPVNDEPHYDEPEAVETPTEAVKPQTEPVNEQIEQDDEQIEQDAVKEDSKIMEDQKKKLLKRKVSAVSLEGDYVKAQVSGFKSNYFVDIDIEMDVCAESISELRELADSLEVLIGCGTL